MAPILILRSPDWFESLWRHHSMFCSSMTASCRYGSVLCLRPVSLNHIKCRESPHLIWKYSASAFYLCSCLLLLFLNHTKLFADSWGDEYFIKHNFMNFHRTSLICILLSFKLQFIIGVGWSISLNVIACCKNSLYQSKLCGQLNEVSLFFNVDMSQSEINDFKL